MTLSTSARFDHAEGRVARTIENQTAKLPSDTFLWAAAASILTSATLQMVGNKHASVFVGQWAPTLLILGLYNKLVKQLGSDALDSRSRTWHCDHEAGGFVGRAAHLATAGFRLAGLQRVLADYVAHYMNTRNAPESRQGCPDV